MKISRKSRGSEKPLTVVSGLRMRAHVSEGWVTCGPPIVLVHGLVVSGRYMVPLLDELASSHAVCAPDLPGFGRRLCTAPALGLPRGDRRGEGQQDHQQPQHEKPFYRRISASGEAAIRIRSCS